MCFKLALLNIIQYVMLLLYIKQAELKVEEVLKKIHFYRIYY